MRRLHIQSASVESQVQRVRPYTDCHLMIQGVEERMHLCSIMMRPSMCRQGAASAGCMWSHS